MSSRVLFVLPLFVSSMSSAFASGSVPFDPVGVPDTAEVSSHYLSGCVHDEDTVTIVHEIVLTDALINGKGGLKETVNNGGDVTVDFLWTISLQAFSGVTSVPAYKTVETRLGGKRASTGNWQILYSVVYDDTTSSPFSEWHDESEVVPASWIDVAEHGDILRVETIGTIASDCSAPFGQANGDVDANLP